MADVLSERRMGLAEAARTLPPLRSGRPVAPATLTRWILNGVTMPDGSRLRLEAIRCGQTWLTSYEALERFLRRQTAAALGEDTLPTPGHGPATERRLDEILGTVPG
jgi:hypothetical protein